ncbi:hypothetical protein V1478_016776 [Vespula squamosa]|uniref:Uncharacterized protein n=1 Tax=Vespula squamosa TaxID=30214 RepID=A0ABD2A0T1_VESSQ
MLCILARDISLGIYVTRPEGFPWDFFLFLGNSLEQACNEQECSLTKVELIPLQCQTHLRNDPPIWLAARTRSTFLTARGQKVSSSMKSSRGTRLTRECSPPSVRDDYSSPLYFRTSKTFFRMIFIMHYTTENILIRKRRRRVVMKEKKELQQQQQQQRHRPLLLGSFLGSIEIPRRLRRKFVGKSREEPMKAERSRVKVLQSRHSHFCVYTFLRITRGYAIAKVVINA